MDTESKKTEWVEVDERVMRVREDGRVDVYSAFGFKIWDADDLPTPYLRALGLLDSP